MAYLTRNDFTITPIGSWNSTWLPVGWTNFQCVYPMGWRVQIPSKRIDVTVKPYFNNQEIIVPQPPNDPGDRYWEGDAKVSGSDNGEAFVEMTGFCPFSPAN